MIVQVGAIPYDFGHESLHNNKITPAVEWLAGMPVLGSTLTLSLPFGSSLMSSLMQYILGLRVEDGTRPHEIGRGTLDEDLLIPPVLGGRGKGMRVGFESTAVLRRSTMSIPRGVGRLPAYCGVKPTARGGYLAGAERAVLPVRSGAQLYPVRL